MKERALQTSWRGGTDCQCNDLRAAADLGVREWDGHQLAGANGQKENKPWGPDGAGPWGCGLDSILISHSPKKPWGSLLQSRHCFVLLGG